MRFNIRGMMLAGSASMLAACAGDTARSKPDLQPQFSGFLGDYTHLRPSPRHEGTLYQQKRSLAAYRVFIVEPIKILVDRTVAGVAIDDATKARLASDLHRQVVETLAINYKVVNAPGPGIAIIRGAVTQLARSRTTEGGTIVIGGAGIEAEIVDSVTGERLGAVVEADVAEGLTDPRINDPYQDARLVFRHWAARLNLWLQSADELGTE